MLPHSALSWNFSLAENLASSILKDRDTEWPGFQKHVDLPNPETPYLLFIPFLTKFIKKSM